jgi:hypothetical protein
MKRHGIRLFRLTYMLYKVNSKQGCRFLLHEKKACINSKLQPIKHVESNVQLLIDLSVDTMPHQLKGIKNGKHDVQ